MARRRRRSSWSSSAAAPAAGVNSSAREPGERRRRERRTDDSVLLAQMRGRIALARARAPRAADVEERHGLGLRFLEPMPKWPPRAHVLRLLLRPYDLAQIRIVAKKRSRVFDRERVQLLDSRHCHARRAFAVLVSDDVVVDLAL